MVAVEGAAAIPGDEGGQTATERAKPALPGTYQKPKGHRVRGGQRGCEGNHYRRLSSTIPATGLGAMRSSRASGEAPCSTSVRLHAGARWSVFKTGSGAGNRRAI